MSRRQALPRQLRPSELGLLDVQIGAQLERAVGSDGGFTRELPQVDMPNLTHDHWMEVGKCMSAGTYVLFVMLQLSGPNPRDGYGEITTGVSTTTAEFYNERKCKDALDRAYATFGSAHVLVTAFCTKK